MKKRFYGSWHTINDPKERFDAKFIINTVNGCWEWTAALNEWGYGQFKYNGKMMLAHRVSHMLYIGEIPPGMLVCHECDNPKCVNPKHFFLGTNNDNVQDSKNKGRRFRPIPHPSTTSYLRLKCRCDECKKVYADYQKNYKLRKKEKAA